MQTEGLNEPPDVTADTLRYFTTQNQYKTVIDEHFVICDCTDKCPHRTSVRDFRIFFDQNPTRERYVVENLNKTLEEFYNKPPIRKIRGVFYLIGVSPIIEDNEEEAAAADMLLEA